MMQDGRLSGRRVDGGGMQALKDLESYMPGEAVVAEMQAQLDGYNRERPGIYNSCMTWALIALGIYAAFGVFILVHASQLINDMELFGLLVGVLLFGAYFLWNFMWSPMEKHQATLRARLFPKLFGFIDRARYDKGQKPAFLKHIAELKLVSYDEASTDDMIAGCHQDMDFDLVEATLSVGSKNKTIVFHGLVFRFTLARPFPGILVVAKRGGWWEQTMKEFWRTGPKLEMSSGNHRLDESHQFYSDNRAAAQPIIAGPLTSVLTWLGNEWHGGDVRLALADGHGYLMLPSKHNYFSLPGMGEDVVYQRHVKPLVRELVMALAVAHVVRQVS
jgi:hypothetical protein